MYREQRCGKYHIGSSGTPLLLRRLKAFKEASAIDNRASIVYGNVLSGTDIEYILQNNRIKENIVIKSPASTYQYCFELGLSGLSAALTNAGSIAITDAETNELKYIIPEPYMVDAEGVYMGQLPCIKNGGSHKHNTVVI